MDEEPKTQPDQRRSRTEALQLVATFATSGAAFCAQHGLRRSTFNRYRRWLPVEKSGAGARWLPVENVKLQTAASDLRESQILVY